MRTVIKQATKLSLLVAWIVICCLPCWLAKIFHKKERYERIIRLCYGGILRIIGIRLTVRGELASGRPLLLVSNHISYLDIALLGSAAPVRFTPKSDMASWPVLGWICKLCNAVFIDRRTAGIQPVKQALMAALEQGDIVSLFPEATTGDGLHLERFKSGFISLAEEKIGGCNLIVQPAAITYTRISRLPIDRTQWPFIAWYGDMTLMPHLMHLLSLGPIDAELVFLPPVTVHDAGDRKALATRCQQDISVAIEAIRARIVPAANNKKYMPKITRLLGGG